MELSQPFIRLPFRFDSDQLQRELGELNENAWMAHPSRMQGNAAVPLVSHQGKDNDDFAGQMLPTKHLLSCQYIQQVIANFDEVIARSRLMRLAPGAEVSKHVDFNYHWYSRVRIHIPITTNPGVTFYCGDAQTHMRSGECWIFDSWRPHRVTNESDQMRVHLVVDTTGSSKFWQLVETMAQHAPSFDEPDFIEQIETIAFDPHRSVKIQTEQYNVAPVMSPGEMEAIAKELILDISQNPDNDTKVIKRYQNLLTSLCKDWRQNWLRFGYETKGLANYQNILERTAKQLSPNPRELVTSSNDVGIRPIIMQRILRAALNPDQLPRFKQSD